MGSGVGVTASSVGSGTSIGPGRVRKQIATIEALGLHKIGQTVIKQDNPATRGMIFRVKHMVKVEEIED